MAPALLLLALLTGGFRPGEALIERLRDRARTPRATRHLAFPARGSRSSCAPRAGSSPPRSRCGRPLPGSLSPR